MQPQQKNQTQPQTNQDNHYKKQSLLNLQKLYTTKKQELINQIKEINNEVVTMEANETLTEEIKHEKHHQIDQLVKSLLVVEKKIDVVDEIREQEECENQSFQAFQDCVEKGVSEYNPTQEQIGTRKEELLIDPNESNWTDATQSQADGQQIWVVDDDIIQAMQEESENQQGQQSEQEQMKKEEKIEEIDYQELESQFVVGGQSDHQIMYGKHDKFCVSVNGILSQNLLFSGGGDDYLHFYNLKQSDPQICLKPYHLIKHSETINKIEVSYSKEYVFTMTDNEVLCTEIKTLETLPLKKREKPKSQKQQQAEDMMPICSDMICHHLGDVVAVSNQFQLQIFNIKGLKPYQTYYCEKQINMFRFTETGKQICVACEDNRLRLLTVKTGQFTTIGGINQHKSQISCLQTKGNIILTGCIEGYIGVSNIKNTNMTALIGTKETEEIYGGINHIQFAGNYFIAGPAQDCIDWFDLTKTKRIFHTQIQGSSTDIVWHGKENQHLYSVSTIKGYIYFYDCRNPLKEINKVRTGNTIHKLWADKQHIVAGCQDGNVRYFDIKKLIN